jgi:very-short-patch-repair endonuclease
VARDRRPIRGRLHRLHDGKREVRIYDYADLDVAMLARMFERRCRGYEAIGYTILLPASAAPGWPAGVPLPVDPAWKRDYAASVRRLETLPETTGRFRLNVELPIPFDRRGQMEVDLLSAQARIAIELDGAQHLADAGAYRRDRKKDDLLQQHRYFVLRFLAEDSGQQLDDVLDRVIAALVHQRENPARDARCG